jgi:hypothetical protein
VEFPPLIQAKLLARCFALDSRLLMQWTVGFLCLIEKVLGEQNKWTLPCGNLPPVRQSVNMRRMRLDRVIVFMSPTC